MVSATIIGAIVVAVLAAGIGAAYSSGALDPLIQQLGMMFFKAKAQAEKKKLQAQGMKEGQDFMNGKLTHHSCSWPDHARMIMWRVGFFWTCVLTMIQTN